MHQLMFAEKWLFHMCSISPLTLDDIFDGRAQSDRDEGPCIRADVSPSTRKSKQMTRSGGRTSQRGASVGDVFTSEQKLELALLFV